MTATYITAKHAEMLDDARRRKLRTDALCIGIWVFTMIFVWAFGK
jgi:hypothetical protein